MPSELETAARRFKANLLGMERTAASRMVNTYGAAWQRLTPRIDNLSEWIRAQREAGNEVPVWRINQLQDLRDFRAQVEAELRQFERYAADATVATQRQAIGAAFDNAADLILTADHTLAAQLVRFNPAAIESFVGFAADGSPLRELFANLGNADAIVDLYVQNLAMGINPRVAARELRRDLAVPLRRALTISRTEMIRSYRTASMDTYRANATLLDGWVWLSAADRRTCAACLAMHGTVHPLSENLNDHPQGRCTAVPWVKGRRPAIPTGDEAFRQLSEADQRTILGPTAYDAWSTGNLRIGDMAKVVSNPRWGDSIRRKTLAELGIEKAPE